MSATWPTAWSGPGSRGLPARYLLGHENLSTREVFGRLARLTGLPEPCRRVPYAVALTAAYVSEWLADVITHRSPAATVTGVAYAPGHALRCPTQPRCAGIAAPAGERVPPRCRCVVPCRRLDRGARDLRNTTPWCGPQEGSETARMPALPAPDVLSSRSFEARMPECLEGMVQIDRNWGDKSTVCHGCVSRGGRLARLTQPWHTVTHI